MRILGIDPGIGRAGWGVIEKATGAKGFGQGKWHVVANGCIETSKELVTEERLVRLFEELTGIIKEHAPDTVAIEDLFFATNAKTAMVVGEARGVLVLAVSLQSLPIASYTPLQVKIAVTGYGQAEKKQVEKLLMLQLGMTEKPKLDDASDALAIALTHAVSSRISAARQKYG
jgi:crossover junction endodeoxyribonuclease RuvC